MNDRAAFHANRALVLGGTDAAGALAVSKWKTRLGIYLDKTGQGVPLEDNPAMFWGRTLEPIVRDEYARRVGVPVQGSVPFARSAAYPFMGGHFDGIREDDGRIVEIKTARSPDEWGADGSADVPVDYLCQVMHYMIVAEVKLADIAVLIGGSDFRVYTVPFDDELAGMIVEAERELWDRIERRDPPEPTTAADVAAMYRIAKAQPIEAVEWVVQSCQRLREWKEDLETAKTLIEAEEMLIKKYMAENDTLTMNGSTLATWKQRKASERLDTKRLKAEAPEVYSRFAVTGEPTRTFLLKEAKQ
jgi:putative phage-type endonuclease